MRTEVNITPTLSIFNIYSEYIAQQKTAFIIQTYGRNMNLFSLERSFQKHAVVHGNW